MSENTNEAKVNTAPRMLGLMDFLGDNPMADLCVATVLMLSAYDKEENPQSGDSK